MTARCVVDTCEKEITDWGYRLSVGVVTYNEVGDGDYELGFIREMFRDGDAAKYLCTECAERRQVYIDELEYDHCTVFDNRKLERCKFPQFETILSRRVDSVLRVEYGRFRKRKGSLTRKRKFVAEQEARVHLDCAIEHWELSELCCMGEGMADVPPALAS